MTDGMITPAEVTAEVNRITAAGNRDPEASHVDTDALVERVLRTIAAFPRTGSWRGRALATAVLPLLDADLERWYA